MANRQRGLLCHFYEDTRSELLSTERRLRHGFAVLGRARGGTECVELITSKVTNAELVGVRVFRKRFDKSKTTAELTQLLVELGLVDSATDAPLLITYLVENDIPCRTHRWFQLFFPDWANITLTREGNQFRINDYSCAGEWLTALGSRFCDPNPF